MVYRNFKQRTIASIAFMLALGSLASAQTTPTPAPEISPERANEIGGIPTIDSIVIQSLGPGTPLRFGNVVAGSERVQLDGRALQPIEDYAIDYATGVIYLKVAPKAGQTLLVTYRYTTQPDPKAPARFSGLNGFKLSLLPGGLNMHVGLGMAERTADGRVLTGNAFGLSNNFKFAGGGVSGMYVVGNRTRAGVRGGMTMQGAGGGQADQSEGKSQAIIQNLGANMMGGRINIDYQDISQNFTAFSSLRDAGASDDQVNRFRSERGLTRLGVSADNLKIGGLGFSTGVRNIADANGSIEWRSYGLKTGGFELNFNSQRVDNAFNRFKDIGEKDREQLERERGMARENLAGTFTSNVGKISFNSVRINDLNGRKGLQTTEYGIDHSKFKFAYGMQSVDAGFGRMGSLFQQEQARFGLDAGLSRQWMALQTSVLGRGTSLTFNQSGLTSQQGAFRATDVNLQAKTWQITHSARSADTGFNGFHGLNRAGANGQPEVDGHIASVVNMYGPGVQSRPEDRQGFSLGAGIDRRYTALSAQPFKGWNLSFSDLQLRGRMDGGSVQNVRVENGKTSAYFRRQELGAQFNEFSNLMGFERWNLGNIAGLDRTDFGFQTSFGNRSFRIDRTDADVAHGGFQRESLAYRDKRLEVTMNTREVSSGLTGLNHAADAERDLLNGLVGYRQRDLSVKWQILPNLNLESFVYDAIHQDNQAENRIRNLSADWKIDPKTRLSYVSTSNRSSDPISTLFAHEVSRLSISRDFGRLGQIAFVQERQNYDGRNTNAPDSQRTFFAWQTKLNDRTNLRTEQTRTTFNNGTDERISANTVQTAVTHNTGIAVTDINVDREGTDRDERRRNYGFFVDFGKGIRLSYGYARHLNGESAGQLTSTLTFGQNAHGNAPDKVNQTGAANVNGVTMGGGYGVNQWDGTDRTQGFSNFRLSVDKPFQFAFLRDVKLNFAMDQASDNAIWMRENRVLNFSAGVGSNRIAYDYVSQLHPSGIRGIDRSFRFETSQSERAWLRASVNYKVRTLPWDDQVMIRNFAFSVRPTKGVELVHRLETNPEQMRGDVLLGSIPTAARSNAWELNWKRSANMTVGSQWRELINDDNRARVRTGGMNLTLFEASGSPLRVFYGVEQLSGNVLRRTTHRYSLSFDQRPGPNQTFSFLVGNLSYEHEIANGQSRNNITLRLNYTLRF